MARRFGTDGVRGLANAELTPELAYDLGRAGAAFLRLRHPESAPVILVGKDTRRSGDMLEAALIAGICAVGVDVRRLGVLPTPGVAWLTANNPAVAGVMISASHNAAPDNGIKFFGANGFKLPDQEEDGIEALIEEKDGIPRPTGKALGRIVDAPELAALYEAHLCSRLGRRLDGLRVVVDCGHGAAHAIAPLVLAQLGAEVTALNTTPDGDNINDNCGSTHLDGLRAAVVAKQAHLGVAFDGDADRMLAVDHQGRPVDGDRIMLICLKHMVATGRLARPDVVATVMSNLGFEEAIRNMGGEFVRAKVGDRYVLEEMAARGIRLGGEQSGHVIFLDDNTTGDGVLTALRLLEALAETGQTLAALADEMRSYPQILKNLRVARLAGWEGNATIAGAVQQATTELAGSGRVLVRASGTEALLRVMIEGKDGDQVDALMAMLASTITSELGSAATAAAT